MRELWMNALDSIRASGVVAGRIEVVVKVQNGLVIIKVIDNGAGLEEVAAGKIGERFSTKGTEGVGLLYCLQYVKEVLKGVLSIRNNTAAPGAIAEIVIPVDVPGFDGGRIEEITHDIKKLLEARKIDPVGIDAGELRKLAERIVAAQQAHQGTGHVRVDLSGISMPGIAADADRVLLGFMGTESAEAVILDERTNISALGMIPGLLTLFNTIRWLPQYRGRIKQLVEKVLAQQSELSCRTFAVYVNTALAQEESLSAWLLDLDFLTLLTEVGGVYNKDRIFESVLAFALTPGASAILSADETVELIKKHGRDSDEILSVLKALIESEVLAVHEEARTFLDAVAQSRHADSFADSIRALVESRSAGKENLSAVIAKLEKLFGIKSVEKDAEASDGQEETIDSSFEIKSVITAASGKKVITADNVTGALDKLIAIREGAGYRKGDVFRLLTTYIESGFVSHANFEVVAQKLLDAAKVLNQNQLFFPEGLLTIIIKQDQKLVSLFDQTLKSWERLVDEVVLDAANRCIAFRGEEKTNYTMAVYNLLVNLVSLGLVDLENVYTVKEQLLELLTKDIFLPSIPEDLCKRAARIQFESIEEMLILLNFMGLVANRCFTRELRAQILDTVVFLRTEGMLNDRTKDLLLKITKVADSQPVEKWRDRSTLFGFWLNLYILCLRQAEFSQIEDSRELYRQIEQTAQDLKMSYESLMSALMRGGKPGEKAEDYLVYLLWLVKEYESPEAARAITVRIAEKMGIASSGKATVELLREIDARLTPFAPAVEEIQTFSVDVQRRSFDIPYNLKVILRDKISQVLRNERGLAEEKLAEAVKALNVASALVAKLQAIPAQDADKFIEGLQELLGHDQVVADRQSIALMTEELVRARQEEADAFSARQQAQQTMEAARGAERKPAAEEYRQAKQRHEQARQKTRADFANARKKLNSILEKKVSNELVNMLTVLVLGKIERKLLSAYYDQTITGTDENVLMARLANAEGADNLLDDAMADIGLNRAFKQHIIAHAKWKMVLGQIVRDKERFLRNEQARTKGIHIELVFKKMNLLTVFQGKYAGTCLQDDVSDMVVDSSGNRRTGMFVINILADGRLAGAVLCDVFAGKLVLLGLDPSEFLVGTWEASAQELLVDEIMPRIAAFAEKNNLEFLIPPSGAGGLSNRSVTFANRIREYMDTGTAVKLPARRYHPIYKYTVDSAYPYKNKKDGGIQQINASAPGNKYIMITMDQQIDNILKASEEYGFTIAFVGGTARRMIARGAPTNGFSNVDMAVLEGDAYKVGDFKRYCAKHLKVKVDIPNFAPGDAWDEPWINPSNIYGGVDDLQTVTISRLMVSRKKDGAWVVSDGTANGEYIQDAVDRKIRLLPALQKEVFDRRLNFEGLLRLARIIAEYPDWEIDPALRQAMKKIIIPPDSEINLLNWMNEFFISQERKSFIRPVLTSFLKIFIHARSKDYAIGALRAIGPPSASLADIFGNIFDLEKAAEAMREAKETGIADEAAWFEKLRSTGAIKELGPDKTISAQRKKEQRHGDKWKTIDEKYSFRSGGELHVLTIETRGDCTYADEVIYRAFFSRQKTRDRFVSNVLQDANIKKKIEAMAGTIDALDANLSTLKHDGAFLSTDAREKLTERIKTLKAKLENGKNDLAAAMADGGLSEVFQRPLAGSVANFEQWAEEITRLYDKELTEEELAKTAQELGLDARQAERIKKQTRRMARILVDFVKSLPDDEKYNVFMLRDGIFIETVAKLLNKKARGFYLSKTTFKAFTQMGVKADLVIPRIILNIKEAMGLGDDVKIPLERYAEFKQRFKKAVK
ncbi:MAG TPA: ATP-binding protein, partial [Candidatus Omnitrophota bacterium]|nr:ATP-binding protein [Candidatus Omnitrophota bacterium]